MSEHDDRYARPDLPATTAEFRAASDVSASTAQFQAFAAGSDAGSGRPARSGQPWTDQAWPEQPKAGAPAARGSGRTVALVLGLVVVVAAAAAVILALA